MCLSVLKGDWPSKRINLKETHRDWIVCVFVCVRKRVRERASECVRWSIRVTIAFDSLAPWCLNIMACVLLAAGSVLTFALMHTNGQPFSFMGCAN